MLTRDHYKKLAAWAERIALLLLASLVVQNIVVGASIAAPSVIMGMVLSLAVYGVAFYLLHKS